MTGASRAALNGSTRLRYASAPIVCRVSAAGGRRSSVRLVRAPDGVDRPAGGAEHRQPEHRAEAARVPHAAGGDECEGREREGSVEQAALALLERPERLAVLHVEAVAEEERRGDEGDAQQVGERGRGRPAAREL